VGVEEVLDSCAGWLSRYNRYIYGVALMLSYLWPFLGQNAHDPVSGVM
jgi:hypothetical protein